MAEYIEREKAIKAVMSAIWERGSDGAMAMEIVASAPAADVRPERHGEWVDYKHSTSAIQCTACEHIFESAIFGYAYCPLCGAKMDGDENAR